MKRKNRLLFLLCLLWGLSGSLCAVGADLCLIPMPRQVEHLRGKGLPASALRYVEAVAPATVPVLPPQLDALPRSGSGEGAVRLRLVSDGVPASDEGYVLEVTSRGVTIHSRAAAGLFYGLQTLGQLLEDSRDRNRPVPCLRITDWPAVSYRAVHFDTKHHLDRMEYYYDEIDRLARYKVNAVIWEIEDKLAYELQPEVAAPGAISKQEMAALCRYARDRHVEISPLVQGLGHASFILKHHPELRENPASDWEFCPSDPRTYELQFRLYRDALEAMPYGRFLHIGGDEITAIGIDERCRRTGKTAFELQMVWLKRVCDFAVSQGRVPIFWDDMPLKHAGLWQQIQGQQSEEEVARSWNPSKLDAAVSLFPKNCIYMRWNYGDATRPAHRRLLDWYRQKGLRVMGATAAAAGDSPFLPRDRSRIGQIRGFCDLVARNGLEGILATCWDDGSPHSETVWRGFAALGEYGWNPDGRSLDAFVEAHAWRAFGLEGPHATAFIDSLERSAFFFDGALVASGRRNPAWGATDFRLIDLPDPSAPGSWSRKHAVRLRNAAAEAVRYRQTAAAIRDALGKARRGRYTLRVYQQTCEMLHYPARLLLALEAYDRATDGAVRLAARDSVARVCAAFAPMRAAVDSVYGETRFMRAPDGYQMDMNHHNHLAAKTLDSGWMYLYERPMTARVEQWLRQHATR